MTPAPVEPMVDHARAARCAEQVIEFVKAHNGPPDADILGRAYLSLRATVERLERDVQDERIRREQAEALLAAERQEVVRLREDAARLDFLESRRDYWVEQDSKGEPELVAHTWLVQKDCLMIAAQKNTLREAIDEEIAARAPQPERGT